MQSKIFKAICTQKVGTDIGLQTKYSSGDSFALISIEKVQAIQAREPGVCLVGLH
jgi:hypothetical protein